MGPEKTRQNRVLIIDLSDGHVNSDHVILFVFNTVKFCVLIMNYLKVF